VSDSRMSSSSVRPSKEVNSTATRHVPRCGGVQQALGEASALAFFVETDPDGALLRALAELSGDACHYQETFLRTSLPPGAVLRAFLLRAGRDIGAFGVGFEQRGVLAGSVTFPTPPRVLDSAPEVAQQFWSGMSVYCQRRRCYFLRINTFEGIPLAIPELGIVITRRGQSEFVLDLRCGPETLWERMSGKHRTNIRKAERHNPTFRVTHTFDTCQRHAMVVSQSMSRRRERGEWVPLAKRAEEYHRLVSQGAGCLLELEVEGDVVSSFLLLTSRTKAYYASAGTTRRGMDIGASYYLMWKTIQFLCGKGIVELNMGGVPEEYREGLALFKTRFGAKEVRLTHAEFFLGSFWVYKALATSWTIRQAALGLMAGIGENRDRTA